MELKKILATEITDDKPFTDIANILMTRYYLSIRGNDFRIAEIEFYYSCDSFNDPYCHKSNQQNKMLTWYIHKPQGTAIKRNGLDITFGNSKSFGGVLIRAIYNEKTDEYIYGPGKIAHFICNTFEEINGTDVFLNMSVHLRQSENKLEQEVYQTRRVGLNIAMDNHDNFHQRNYRFFTYPQKRHRDKEKVITKTLASQGFSNREINSIFGYRITP